MVFVGDCCGFKILAQFGKTRRFSLVRQVTLNIQFTCVFARFKQVGALHEDRAAQKHNCCHHQQYQHDQAKRHLYGPKAKAEHTVAGKFLHV